MTDENTIDFFDGTEYEWLSNFAFAAVEMDGLIFPTTENAFQAAKTTDHEQRKLFVHVGPGMAKAAGRQVDLREDWNDVKEGIMYRLNWQKYNQPLYKEKLLATGNRKLIEGNTWNDQIWGVCNGVGQNLLGKILMRIRNELRHTSSVDAFKAWVAALPDNYWAKYDLSACRLGWDAAINHVNSTQATKEVNENGS